MQQIRSYREFINETAFSTYITLYTGSCNEKFAFIVIFVARPCIYILLWGRATEFPQKSNFNFHVGRPVFAGLSVFQACCRILYWTFCPELRVLLVKLISLIKNLIRSIYFFIPNQNSVNPIHFICIWEKTVQSDFLLLV